MPTPTHELHDEAACDDSASGLPALLAPGSAVLLGDFMGRVGDRRDFRAALRRTEQSPEPITLSIRTL